ncbi:MAG: methyltransferase domain-containing protein [Pseudomonadota bacterium]
MTEKYFDKVYQAKTPEETLKFYAEWSESYDAEVAENGYVTPARAARLLADVVIDKATPILDFGCGTGLSGKAFAAQGFTCIDGLDISQEMIAKAEETGVYRRLKLFDPKSAPPLIKGAYGVVAAIGVIGAGAAPISVFNTLMEALTPGGLLIISFNDHTLEDPDCAATTAAWIDSGRATELRSEYGPHLPVLGVKSDVKIFQTR